MTMPSLDAWQSFYVIVGSSAGALTGLQFVVIALLPTTRHHGTSAEINAFASPTVVHFCLVLLVAVMLSAPWHNISWALLAVTCDGIGGLIYLVIVWWRARRQTGYTPVAEDWIWHFMLPAVAYGALAVSGIAIAAATAPWTVAGAVVLLLFAAIHNAWDSAVFVAIPEAGGSGDTSG